MIGRALIVSGGAVIAGWLTMIVVLGNVGLQRAISATEPAQALLLDKPWALLAIAAVAGLVAALGSFAVRISRRAWRQVGLFLLLQCLVGGALAVLLVGELGLTDLLRCTQLVSANGLVVVAGVVGTIAGGRSGDLARP